MAKGWQALWSTWALRGYTSRFLSTTLVLDLRRRYICTGHNASIPLDFRNRWPARTALFDPVPQPPPGRVAARL